jgi:hypothetical protein
MTNLPLRLQRSLQVILPVAAAVLFGLHFVHLTADFPNHSPWMDWSKYTDEGWYGDAAIRHFQLGHWYVPGDFNPAAALPALPLLEGLVFHFTGVSLAAARALTVCLFGAILVASWLLIAAHSRHKRASLAAATAVLLLAANPFCFVFTRMAIIEPLLVLLTMLALLASTKIRPQIRVPHISLLRCGFVDLHANLLPILALGFLLPAMVLAKTTALFLMPGVFWILFANSAYRIPAFMRIAFPPAAIALTLWSVYFLAVVRPHFLIDYRYLFSANAYTGMTHQNFASVLASMVADGDWMGRVYGFSLAAAAVALFQFRRLAARPLIPALLLWSAGYMAFLAYHNNLQPRYYLVVAVPLTLLLPVVVEDLVLPSIRPPLLHAVAVAATTMIVAFIAIPDAIRTVAFVRHPEYTLVRAAGEVAAYIRDDLRSDPTHNPLILSISGSDISLMTGLPSICDDFGTLELVDRVKRYKPGWYVAWNQVEDDKMDAMTRQYRLERVAAFPAMDDSDRNLLILYKLYPSDSPNPRSPRPRSAPPKRLRSRLGQQPSANQLLH